MSPTVQVILTSYNSGRYLQQAIASVVGQTYRDWGLWVVDDGSTDPVTQQLLGQAEFTDERFRVIRLNPTLEARQRTVRYTYNINRVARLSDSKYLTFLCGDDYYTPDRLERMVDAFLRIRGHVVYGAQQLIWENDPQRTEMRFSCGVLKDAFHRVDLNSVMVSRRAFNAVGGFPTDPKLWRDADAHMWQRLTNAGYMFHPVAGGFTDTKRYRDNSVDARCIRGETPWC